MSYWLDKSFNYIDKNFDKLQECFNLLYKVPRSLSGYGYMRSLSLLNDFFEDNFDLIKFKSKKKKDN